jgi:DNA-binding IclR family transcriptional regulator
MTLPKAKNGSQTIVPNLERGLLILEHLREHPDGQCISDISRALDVPVNSVFRILNTLDKHNYVQRKPGTKSYVLTRKMMSIGYDAPVDRTLMENSLDVMRAVRDQVGETVVVSIIDGFEGLVLEQVPGVHPFRFVCDAGTRQALHASASTKSILAHWPEAELAKAYERMTFEAFTERTITSRSQLEAELEEVRTRGYAVDTGEALDGVHCVAAPILDQRGVAIAAVTVTGPSNRLRVQDFARIGRTVARETARISERFGYGLVKNGNGT